MSYCQHYQYVFEDFWQFMIYCCLFPHSYVLTLITDGMRSVRAFHFDKAAASVLTTCVSFSFKLMIQQNTDC